MARAISLEEFERSSNDLVRAAGQQTVLIQQGGETVAVLVSPEQYETTHEAKAQKAVDSMWAFRNHMQSVTTPEEIDALERDLLQRAK